MSKKLEEKQQRRLAEERRLAERKSEQRKKNLITLGIAALVIAVVAALVISDRQKTAGPVGVAREEAGCGDIESVEATGNDHIDVGATHEPYNSSPPTNGPHYASPADQGFYPSALPPEQVVHNLEHGNIVIWYDPAAPQSLKDDIEAIVDKEPASTVATPFEEIEDFNFYLTAWNKLPSDDEEDFGTGYFQGCESVSQEVIDEFRTKHQGKSPEPLTRPFSG